MRRTMPLALALLILFSMITGPAAATVSWSGFTGQSDGFQRGDRITATHMNEIDAALDSIKADLDPISSGQGDFIQISGSDVVNLNIIPGDGIDISQAGSNPVAATFAVDLHATGPGLSFTSGQLSLLRTCTTNQVLAWNGSQWACADQSSGGSTLTVDGGIDIASPNFITGTGGAGFLDVDFVQATNDISGRIDMSSITSVGTLTATTIGDLLTLSADGIKFTGSTAGYTCTSGTGGIYYDGTNMRMCDNGADVLVNQGNVNADEIYVNGAATVDGNNRLDLRGGNGVTATLDAAQTPDRVTFAVDLNGTVDGTGSNSNLSGLEFTATNELAILQGCSNGDTIAWNEASSLWECGARTVGSSSIQVDTSGTIIQSADLQDTSTVNVTDTSGVVTFDVIGTGITSLGTLTTELVVSNLGAEFIAGDALTNCSTFTSTNGGIFYDDSEGKFKKCEDNVLSDLAPDVNNITGNLDVAGGGNLTVAGDITVSGAVEGTAGKVNINGDADQPQLVVEGHSTQTTNPDLLVVQTSAGTDLFTVNNSGRTKTKEIYDIDTPSIWRVQDDGAAYFQSVGDSAGSSTWDITTGGVATFDGLTVGSNIASRAAKVEIGGESSQVQLMIKGAAAQADGTPVFEIENGGDTTKTTQIFQNGVIRAESIQDITGPGTNWNIPTNGAAIFDSITDNTAGTPTWSISNVGDASLNKALIGDQNPFNLTYMYNSLNPVPTVIVASENALQTAMVVTAHSSSDGTNLLHPYVFRVDRERLAGGANYPLFTVDPDGTIFADAIQPHDAIPNWSITENGVAAFTQVRAAGISGVAGMGFDVTDFFGAAPGLGGYPTVAGLGDNNADNNADADMDMICGTDAGYTGCELNWYVGRQMSGSANPVPELQIIDRISASGLEKNYITNNEPILLNAPILAGNAADTGSPGIDLATGTIQGGVQVNNIAAPGTITNPKGQWYFVTTNGGDITLGSSIQGTAVGQNVCIHATTTGVINISPYSTAFNLVLDGVQYTTAPTLSSSGAAGDFVCLLLANPSTTQPVWHVLGRSGSWTAANGT